MRKILPPIFGFVALLLAVAYVCMVGTIQPVVKTGKGDALVAQQVAAIRETQSRLVRMLADQGALSAVATREAGINTINYSIGTADCASLNDGLYFNYGQYQTPQRLTNDAVLKAAKALPARINGYRVRIDDSRAGTLAPGSILTQITLYQGKHAVAVLNGTLTNNARGTLVSLAAAGTDCVSLSKLPVTTQRGVQS